MLYKAIEWHWQVFSSCFYWFSEQKFNHTQVNWIEKQTVFQSQRWVRWDRLSNSTTKKINFSYFVLDAGVRFQAGGKDNIISRTLPMTDIFWLRRDSDENTRNRFIKRERMLYFSNRNSGCNRTKTVWYASWVRRHLEYFRFFILALISLMCSILNKPGHYC